MLGKNIPQNNFNKYNFPAQNEPYGTPKNYLNYVSFQTNTNIVQREQPRQPDHVAMYALNVQQHPHPRSPQVDTSSSINRNPYLNPGIQSRRQPPKQALSRNSSNKQQIVARQSQELNKTKAQSLKNISKSNSQSQNRMTSELIQPANKSPLVRGLQNNNEFGSPAWSQTVDLGEISRNKSTQNSVYPSPEEDQIKQKLNYLEVIEQAICQFQMTRAPQDLQRLNQDNKLLMIRAYEEIKRFKEQKNRRSINDSVSQSDYMSEDGVSVEGRQDARNNSLRLKNEKKRYLQGFSRSKQKDRAAELQIQKEMRINQKLKQEYQEQLAKSKKKQSPQLDKLNQAIAFQQKQISKLSALNSEVTSKLNKLPFFQQWKIMCEESEGAKKISLKLRNELKTRSQKLKTLLSGADFRQNNQQKQSIHQQDSRSQESHLSKNKAPQTNNLKIPPSPIHRSQGMPTPSTNSNRIETSIKYGGDNRPKSINRNPSS